METTQKTKITIETLIQAPAEKVWTYWTNPVHIIHWNAASDDWHSPYAENDLHTGGKFLSRMEARDGSFGFDFGGIYDEVKTNKLIAYTMDDNRKVRVTFSSEGSATRLTEIFEAESENSVELQRSGWQAILDNFKKYVETSDKTAILHFEIKINAGAEKVYTTMLEKEHYDEWTAEFNPTSHYEGSWEKGAKIIFIGTDQDGKSGGMVSRIKENIPNKFVSIEHLGLLQDGKEITSGDEVEGWAGALENYRFNESNGVTTLIVDVDSNKEFKAYFEETWPKALKKLKSICESA